MLHRLKRWWRRSDRALGTAPQRARHSEGVWISMALCATRQAALGVEISAHCRHVVRFDGRGHMGFEKSTQWRPFAPVERDAMTAELSMFEGIRLVMQCTLGDAQWRQIDRFGLEAFLEQAAEARSFEVALARVARTRVGRAA